MQTIYFENNRGEQYKVMVIDREIDSILDQLNAIAGIKFLSEDKFDQEDLITIDLTKEPDQEKIGELSFKKVLIVHNDPQQEADMIYHS
jgi:hypothetical protein